MLTEQNYDGQDETRPDSTQTGEKSPQSVDSDRLSASLPFNDQELDDQPDIEQTDPPTYESGLELGLSILGNNYRDSTAMLVYRALWHYKRDRLNWLVKHMSTGEHSDAGGVMEEIELLDQLCFDLTARVQDVAQQNYGAALYRVSPDHYADREEALAEMELTYENKIDALIS